MRRLRYIVALCICSLTLGSLTAQELNCNVTINSDQIEGSNKQIFNTLQQSISEFVNNTRWTNMTVAEQERIECNMMIIVSSVSPENMFSAELQVQARRPVYGTTYTTPTLNFKDNNFNFTYQEFDQLQYQDQVFNTNLTAMLTYYCYLIIGYDMDSFSRLGGTPYFQQCENIITACQTATMEDSEMKGWTAFSRASDSNRNRYALINNIMDDAFKEYRLFFYDYHRLALDQMQSNVSNGRAKIAEGMPILQKTYSARPTTYLINCFLDTKSDELVNIFRGGTNEEKQAVYDILMAIDPTRQNTYDRIKK